MTLHAEELVGIPKKETRVGTEMMFMDEIGGASSKIERTLIRNLPLYKTCPLENTCSHVSPNMQTLCRSRSYVGCGFYQAEKSLEFLRNIKFPKDKN